MRSAYLRSGYELPPDPGQIRFFESASQFLDNMEALSKEYPADSTEVRFGVAPHSLRAVPLRELKEIAAWTRERKLPLHMHVAEQIGENEACLREYGLTPVALLGREGLLAPDFTAVHAIHITADEIELLARANATVCSCPTTERNLGDGVIAADQVMRKGIRIAFGSDSQAQIDPLEDARELEYHLRLERQQRAILDQIGEQTLASRLFDCATVHGARALGVPAGELAPGSSADFFTVDLDDVSIAGQLGRRSIAFGRLLAQPVRYSRCDGEWPLGSTRSAAPTAGRDCLPVQRASPQTLGKRSREGEARDIVDYRVHALPPVPHWIMMN